MYMLTQEETSNFKEKLLASKKDIEQRLENGDHFDLDQTFWKESMGELSSYDNHPADAGSALFEREKDVALNEHLETELININHALHAIENGTYGKCSVCSKDIPIERLDALPTTTFCIDHSQDQLTSHNRPVEEEILNPHIDRLVNDDDREKIVSFDAEDSWQSVASWGTSDSPSDVANPPDNYNDVYINSDENIGYVEDYESFVGVDMEGNITIYPNDQHEQLEDLLDEEGIMTTFGDLPVSEHEPYVEENDKEDRR